MCTSARRCVRAWLRPLQHALLAIPGARAPPCFHACHLLRRLQYPGCLTPWNPANASGSAAIAATSTHHHFLPRVSYVSYRRRSWIRCAASTGAMPPLASSCSSLWVGGLGGGALGMEGRQVFGFGLNRPSLQQGNIWKVKNHGHRVASLSSLSHL